MRKLLLLRPRLIVDADGVLVAVEANDTVSEVIGITRVDGLVALFDGRQVFYTTI